MTYESIDPSSNRDHTTYTSMQKRPNYENVDAAGPVYSN